MSRTTTTTQCFAACPAYWNQLCQVAQSWCVRVQCCLCCWTSRITEFAIFVWLWSFSIVILRIINFPLVLWSFSIVSLRIVDISCVLLTFPILNLRIVDISLVLLSFSIVNLRIVDISLVLLSFSIVNLRIIYI